MSLITLLFKSTTVEPKTQEMAGFCGFCVSFHASSYCMLTEITTALMFQNFDKYVIFNKVAL